MDWKELHTEAEMNQLIRQSFEKPQVVLKHSTTCPISGRAYRGLSSLESNEAVDFHLLSVWDARPVSDKLAAHFQIKHQSPQVLLIRNGECVFEEDHFGIKPEEVMQQANLHA